MGNQDGMGAIVDKSLKNFSPKVKKILKAMMKNVENSAATHEAASALADLSNERDPTANG
jgi:hypothetical protein